MGRLWGVFLCGGGDAGWGCPNQDLGPVTVV